jgi:hypothetical protein
MPVLPGAVSANEDRDGGVGGVPDAGDHTRSRRVAQRPRTAAFSRRDPVIRGPSRSFSAYLASAACRRDWVGGPYGNRNEGLFGRMIRADIKSLPQLLRWARERYPEEYRQYHYWNECTGRDMTLRLWAKYLDWCDALI